MQSLCEKDVFYYGKNVFHTIQNTQILLWNRTKKVQKQASGSRWALRLLFYDLFYGCFKHIYNFICEPSMFPGLRGTDVCSLTNFWSLYTADVIFLRFIQTQLDSTYYLGN